MKMIDIYNVKHTTGITVLSSFLYDLMIKSPRKYMIPNMLCRFPIFMGPILIIEAVQKIDKKK